MSLPTTTKVAPSIKAVSVIDPLVTTVADASTVDGSSCGVYKGHGGHVCIAFKFGNVNVHYIALMKGELVTRSMPDEWFAAEYPQQLNAYPMERAVKHFLQHAGGVSPKAREVLIAML